MFLKHCGLVLEGIADSGGGTEWLLALIAEKSATRDVINNEAP